MFHLVYRIKSNNVLYTPTAHVEYKNHLWNDRNKRAGKEELVSAKKEKRGIKEEIITEEESLL